MKHIGFTVILFLIAMLVLLGLVGISHVFYMIFG
jgi:hypothetical protein